MKNSTAFLVSFSLRIFSRNWNMRPHRVAFGFSFIEICPRFCNNNVAVVEFDLCICQTRNHNTLGWLDAFGEEANLEIVVWFARDVFRMLDAATDHYCLYMIRRSTRIEVCLADFRKETILNEKNKRSKLTFKY